MTFLIVTHVPYKLSGGRYYAYGPYVREMNIWLRYPEKVIIVAPLIKESQPGAIDLAHDHPDIEFITIPEFDILGLRSIIRTFFLLPLLLCRIARGMRKADHIHLRCPGNVGLLGCVVQIFFPGKKKTAKFAGNWDPAMRKVRTYNWQRTVLSDERISRKMSVLVYGEWPSRTKNIIPFFTASYHESEIVDSPARSLEGTIRCVYCGYLLKEKRPLQSIMAVEKLAARGYDIELVLMGNGPEYSSLENYIKEKGLGSFVHLKGDVTASEVKSTMQQSNFLTFYGHDSEGWPKVVAESMFWGCVPLVRSVSCTRFMLGNGERGTIVEDSVESMSEGIQKYLDNPVYYKETAEKAMRWSRQYTLEKFEKEISSLLLK